MAFEYRKKQDVSGSSKVWHFMEEEFDSKQNKTGRVRYVIRYLTFSFSNFYIINVCHSTDAAFVRLSFK
jgi:hypothetical protein